MLKATLLTAAATAALMSPSLTRAADASPPSAAAAETAASYQLRLLPNGDVELRREGTTAIYRPQFSVIASATDPGLEMSQAATDPRDIKPGVMPESYQLPLWRRADGGGKSDNPYQSGTVTQVRAASASVDGNGVVTWRFADTADFSLEATVAPGADAAPPVIRWRFTARKPSWYSVGYTGGPATDPAKADNILQPLIWQERRFPARPVLTLESMGGLPVTFVNHAGVTQGIAVDPGESPYRLPVLANARFGVILRNPDGQAQPAVFAPVPGGAGARFEAGQSSSFAVRPLIMAGNWYDAFTRVARDIYGFADVRENFGGSLNTTIDNMVAFAMDDAYSGWNPDLRGFDYESDVKGTVKVVSALHPLSMALITDDPEIYRRRALPVTEYLMSRTKYLYNSIGSIDVQNAARDMRGPAAEVSELGALYQFSRGASPVFKHYADLLENRPRALNLLMVSDGNNFWSKLARYRLTGEPAALGQARRLADAYIQRRIDTPQRDFTDARLSTGGQFWSDFAPRWTELFELWQETGERRYLDAAAEGARRYASFSWFYPRIPAGDVTVDASGGAPLGWAYRGHDEVLANPNPMPTPPRTLPAWQVSQIGLAPEASTTFVPNPAVLLAHHASYFLRIAKAADDPFLHDVARSAVVGRYLNYPGYDINEAFSNVYARSDYPLRPFDAFSYNQIYFNHVWPHIALLNDYLISDIEMRSGGAIAFPSRYAQGYAYLISKVYGDRPGKFMGDDNVRLWMPRGFARIDNVQVNYLSGYGNGRVYLALTNESQADTVANVQLDLERVPAATGKRFTARLWRDGKPAGSVTVTNGRFSAPLSARGITAVAIDGLGVFTKLQNDYFGGDATPAGAGSFRTDPTPLGDVTAMVLTLGRANRDLYVWTQASDRDVREVRFTFDLGGKKAEVIDSRHPFEASLPMGSAARADYGVAFVRQDGSVEEIGTRSVNR